MSEAIPSVAIVALQASFDDLGTHLSQVTFCVVDLETTGGAETDMITEVGAVKVRGGEVLGGLLSGLSQLVLGGLLVADDLVGDLPVKGQRVWICGSIQRRFWEAPDGRRSRLEVVAEQINIKDVEDLEPVSVG